jgi:hypothetical protein
MLAISPFLWGSPAVQKNAVPQGLAPAPRPGWALSRVMYCADVERRSGAVCTAGAERGPINPAPYLARDCTSGA